MVIAVIAAVAQQHSSRVTVLECCYVWQQLLREHMITQYWFDTMPPLAVRVRQIHAADRLCLVCTRCSSRSCNCSAAAAAV
jgi:hypothetical protein